MVNGKLKMDGLNAYSVNKMLHVIKKHCPQPLDRFCIY